MCIGADDRSSKVLRRLVRREIGEIFLCDVKSGYIEKRLCGIKLGDCAKRLLVHALTGFDREEEEDMLRDRLTVGRRFDIDGFCRFRMREFYLRWDEMCSLARRHGDFLADEDTFRDLIRFLVDAGKRKGTRAEVYRLGGKFRLVERNGGTETETTYDGLDDLVCRLIVSLRMKRCCSGSSTTRIIKNSATYSTRNAIFCVSRRKNTCQRIRL